MSPLARRAWLGLGALALVMGLVLFITAGTLAYWQAWIYLIVFTGTSTAVTLRLLHEDPALVERRLRGGPTAETRGLQRVIMTFTSLGFVALLVVPALDRRFGWSDVPAALSVAGNGLVVLGFYLISRVYRVNTFASATIEIADDQRVITTGPYAIVRHPMYASASFYLLGTPLALGSYWGLIPLACTVPFLIWRLLDEERFLAARLPGYREYQGRVRHRLVPFVW